MQHNRVCSSTSAGLVIHIAISFKVYLYFLLTGLDNPYYMIMSNHQGTSGPHESENFVDALNLPGEALTILQVPVLTSISMTA